MNLPISLSHDPIFTCHEGEQVFTYVLFLTRPSLIKEKLSLPTYYVANFYSLQSRFYLTYHFGIDTLCFIFVHLTYIGNDYGFSVIGSITDKSTPYRIHLPHH